MTKKKSNTHADIHKLHTLPEDLREIWELSGEIKYKDPDISTEETEEALDKVFDTLDLNKATPRFSIKKIAIAAAILIGALLNFLNFYQISYQAPAGEQLTVTLPDESQVVLNGNSKVSHSLLFGITNRDLKLEGEGFFSVTTSETPFTVQGATTRVTVHGTEFNVLDWGNMSGISSAVMVYEGKVSVRSGNKETIYLTANEATTTDELTSELIKYSFQSDHSEPAWTKGELVFNDLSLSEFFNRLEVHFGQRIQFEDPRFDDEMIEARYSGAKKLSDILNDISVVKDLTIEQTRNGYTIR